MMSFARNQTIRLAIDQNFEKCILEPWDYTYILLDHVKFNTEETFEFFGLFLALSEVGGVLSWSEGLSLLLSQVLARVKSVLDALDAQAGSLLHAAPLLQDRGLIQVLLIPLIITIWFYITARDFSVQFLSLAVD